jgi:C-terminal processing protease CtpA/Prc
MKNSHFTGVCLLTLALVRCATAAAPRVQLPSGHPEVDIRIDKKIVIDHLANAYSASGFTIKTVNDYSLVVEKADPSLVSSFLFGTRFSGTPNVRVIFNLADSGAVTHVGAQVQMVTNPGSGFENVTDISSSAGDLQKQLTDMKAAMEAGVVGLRFGKDLVVADVTPGSPADVAGMTRGDKIEKIAGQPVSTYEGAVALIRGEPGSSVEISVARNGGAKSFTVTRKTYSEVFAKK